jgi:hypothetical protein
VVRPHVRSACLALGLLVGLMSSVAHAQGNRGVTVEVDAGVAVVATQTLGPIFGVVPLSLAVEGFIERHPHLGVRVAFASIRNIGRRDPLWSVHALVERTWRRGRVYIGAGIGLHVLTPVPFGAQDLEPDRGIATSLRIGWVLDRSATHAWSVVAGVMPSFFGGDVKVYESSVALSWQAW